MTNIHALVERCDKCDSGPCELRLTAKGKGLVRWQAEGWQHAMKDLATACSIMTQAKQEATQ